MVFAISDLHLAVRGDKPMDIFGGNWEGYMDSIKQSWRSLVTEDDTVLIAGDISWAISLEDALNDINEFATLPGKKVIIRGNHDYWWKSYAKLKNALPHNVFAIQNNSIRLDNLLICGTRGWTLAGDKDVGDDKKIYDRELIRLELALEDMKSKRKEGDTVIGMIHYPPFGAHKEESGFTRLFARYGVQKVVYGHLHGRDVLAYQYVKLDGVEYYLTSCDLVGNKLVKII
ncbi:MAG: serine/threonine protein phosphatase [Clostridia bacterium]|nr:serine/threonine protein phosphatase [Clostridia bacterium]